MGIIKKTISSVKFLILFVHNLGGIRVFMDKIIKIFRSQGKSGMLKKCRYILLQAKAGSTLNPFQKQENQRIYNKYIAEKPSKEKLTEIIKTFASFPLISVIMPTYNSNVNWLAEAIESVRNQIYDHWELCIADDASTDIECKTLLKKYVKEDKRIKVAFRNENGHISKASNSALEIATGDFVALLDHDDKLSEDALFWIAKTINDKPDVKLIYSDEDKFDAEGVRSDPYFKCDWNYSLFLSQNYICHLGVYKTQLVKMIGGFRPGFEGSQDYDLTLRFIEQISPDQIKHIPRVLYHWRIHSKSTAMSIEDKPYALTAGRRAIGDHLRRKAISAEVEILDNQMYRVKYDLPEKPPLVSIIIPTKNNFKLLKKCINSITSKTDYNNYEILIIDNNSDDLATLKYLGKVGKNKKINVLTDKRDFNFSAINNKAVKNANGDFICFLNDDTEVISTKWLSAMVSIGIQEGVGAVGARLWYPDNTLQHGGVVLGIGGVASHAHKRSLKGSEGYFNRATLTQEFSAVTAACMLVSKKVFSQAGGFDEVNLTVAFNDVDLCLKIRELNYRIVWSPLAELYHHESISRGEDIIEETNKRFIKENEFMEKKWAKWIKNDPAYSPNLTLIAEDFSLAWPSRL